MTPPDCIFCKVVSGQIPSAKVFENDRVLAFLDISPVSDGHTLVIPKAHYARLDQADPAVLQDIAAVLGNLAAAVQKAAGAEAYNVLCNNGAAAGQVVEHLHFHIIPRSKGDGVFGHWPAKAYPDGRAAAIAEKIIQNLSL